MKSTGHNFNFQGQYAQDRKAHERAQARAEEVVQAVLAKAACPDRFCVLCGQPFTPRMMPTLKRATTICFPCAVRKFREVCVKEAKTEAQS